MTDTVAGESALPLADVTYADSRSAVGLQMADLIAYEFRKAIAAVILNDEISPGRLAHDVELDPVDDEWVQFGGGGMEPLVVLTFKDVDGTD